MVNTCITLSCFGLRTRLFYSRNVFLLVSSCASTNACQSTWLPLPHHMWSPAVSSYLDQVPTFQRWYCREILFNFEDVAQRNWLWFGPHMFCHAISQHGKFMCQLNTTYGPKVNAIRAGGRLAYLADRETYMNYARP